MERGSCKDGRPTVSNIIQAREAEASIRDFEAALRKELAEERKPHEAFRREESYRTSLIIAENELEYLQQVQHLRGLSSSDHDSNPPPGLLEKTFEPAMTFFDLISSDSSKKASTQEQRRHVQRPHPNDDDLWSLGSYTRPKTIPKKDNIVDELKLQYEFEIKALRTEMERKRAEQ